MATRRASLKYKDLASFFSDHDEHLSSGFCFLPPGTVRGELAPEIKLDISIPIIGRVGPLTAQVVQRAPDGSYGLQLPDFESEAGRTLKKLDKAMDAARAYFEATGQLGAPVAEPDPGVHDELEQLRARVAELEAKLDAAQAPAADAVPDAPPEPDEPTVAADEAEVADAPVEEPAADEPADAAPEPDDAPPPADDATEAVEPVAVEEAAVPRGIPIVDVSRLEPALEGVTEGGGLRIGIMDIAGGNRTGMLTIHEEDGSVRYAYFASGGPVAWRSVPLQEREVLGMLLLQAGQINKDQLRESLDLMQSKGIRQGEAFIEMGVMSFSQLIMVLGKQNEFIFQKVMKSASGSWTFHDLPKLPESFLPPPVRVGALLFRTMVTEAKGLRGKRLADQLRDHINSYIQIAPERRRLFADLGLNATERRLVAIIAERTLRMRELFSMSPLSRQNTAAVFYALIKLNMFSFGETETHERYLQRVGGSIAKKKRQLIQTTHFDVLEVHWISLPEEIREAHMRLKEEYDVASYNNLPDDLAKTVRRISARIDEAFEVLNDDLQRREYRKTLVEDFMIVQSAQLLAKKGEMAIMRKDRRMAVSCFAKALELQPRSPEYRSSLQRARAV